MRLGWHVRGWLVAGVLALAVLMLVAIPPAYIHDAYRRRVFVGVTIPGGCMVYAFALYKILHRPLSATIASLSVRRPTDDASLHSATQSIAPTKELRKLDHAIGIVLKENELMRRFLPRHSGDPHAAVPSAVTPTRSRSRQGDTRHTTPPTIARDVSQPREAGMDDVPVPRGDGAATTKPHGRRTRLDGVSAGHRSAAAAALSGAPTRIAPTMPRVVFSAPGSDVDEELSLHSFPPSPAG